ncbi:NUDIX domain-containing protein [Pseudarthrobacter sp. L19]|uniref:NUDIX domain-containing protein n=1 Tax=Pseudarthrobacter sp. L19 TaxID=3423951 RepID=UPI003D7A065D
MPREVAKVVCYVVHDNHLLVFTHDHQPMALTGVQVPAGSINAGESPEVAAVRELFEETGRQGQVIRHIGVQEYDLRPGRDEIAVRHYFEMRLTDADIAERWVAGEPDPSHGRSEAVWTCWWIPLTDAHVLAAGFGGLLGSMVAQIPVR